MAKKISIGPWTISATRAPAGVLSIEVLLGDVSPREDRARGRQDGQ
jgi:hypothetical protein